MGDVYIIECLVYVLLGHCDGEPNLQNGMDLT